MDILRNFGYRAQLLMLIGIMTVFVMIVEVFYYAQFTRITHERESSYEQIMTDEAHSRLEQMATLMRSTSAGIENTVTMQNYISRTTSVEKKLARDAIYDIIGIVTSYNPYASGIMIADENGLASTASITVVSVPWLHAELDRRYGGLLSLGGDAVTPIMSGAAPNSRPFICFIHPIRSPGSARGDNARAVCVIVLELSKINVMIDDPNKTENAHFYLLDAYGDVIQTNKGADPQIGAGQLAGLAASMSEGDGRRFRIEGVEYLAYIRHNSALGWRTVGITPVREINAQLNAVQQIAVAMALISLAFCLATGFFFSGNMSRPLEKLLADLSAIGATNMSRRIPVRARNEIGTITAAINGMLDKLQEMTANIFNMQNKMYESELRLKEAELRSLQAQINPHFLYNTLDCVRGIALAENVPPIAAITEAMAGIFRYAIGGGAMSTVAAELDSARSYAEIISVRFGGKIRFEFRVDPQILPVRAAKLVLQPIIENAVHHGLSDAEDGGLIAIDGFAEGELAILEITDDGAGMGEDLMAQLNARFAGEDGGGSKGGRNSGGDSNGEGASGGRSAGSGTAAGNGGGCGATLSDGAALQEPPEPPPDGRGIGLANINSRLKLFFGSAYGVSVRCAAGASGTTVRLSMPASAEPGTATQSFSEV
ncbi:MAG: histidine kinase [Clostridiales bacterium]|jgi:two-component system sensor histidine kinase YesM|nr:histidine kinase [Clostridiales bacterium]